MGLWVWGGLEQRGSYSRKISRHQAGRGLPSVPGSHGKRSALAFARCAGEYRDADHGIICDVARIKREWPLLRPSRIALFQPRQDRRRPGRRLQQTQAHERSWSRAMARAKLELRSRGIASGAQLRRATAAHPGSAFESPRDPSSIVLPEYRETKVAIEKVRLCASSGERVPLAQ